eukprot:2265306-Prymnesium_polylepis.1
MADRDFWISQRPTAEALQAIAEMTTVERDSSAEAHPAAGDGTFGTLTTRGLVGNRKLLRTPLSTAGSTLCPRARNFAVLARASGLAAAPLCSHLLRPRRRRCSGASGARPAQFVLGVPPGGLLGRDGQVLLHRFPAHHPERTGAALGHVRPPNTRARSNPHARSAFRRSQPVLPADRCLPDHRS